MKKVVALFLSLVLVLSMSMMVFASEAIDDVEVNGETSATASFTVNYVPDEPEYESYQEVAVVWESNTDAIFEYIGATTNYKWDKENLEWVEDEDSYIPPVGVVSVEPEIEVSVTNLSSPGNDYDVEIFVYSDDFEDLWDDDSDTLTIQAEEFATTLTSDYGTTREERTAEKAFDFSGLDEDKVTEYITDILDSDPEAEISFEFSATVFVSPVES